MNATLQKLVDAGQLQGYTIDKDDCDPHSCYKQDTLSLIFPNGMTLKIVPAGDDMSAEIEKVVLTHPQMEMSSTSVHT